MRWVILRTAGFFGRYTAILIFVVVLVGSLYWLDLLDTNPLAFFLSGIIVLPLILVSVLLVIGLLFSGIRPAEGRTLTRREAPELWAIWDEFSSQPRVRRQIILDDQMNAAIGERRRIVGLFGREVTMYIGLPMLIYLDLPALRSIIAHEVTHNDLRHTSGGANIAEFEQTFESVFDYFDPEETITGSFLYGLLGRLGDWLEQEVKRLSRVDEFAADRGAAEREGVDVEIRSSTLFAAAASFYEHEILEPLSKEMLGAVRAPTPPLQRLSQRLPEFRRPETIVAHAKLAWQKETDPHDTHPSFKDRIRALGADRPAVITGIDLPAADIVFSKELNAELLAAFNKRWANEVDEYLSLE